MDSKDYTQVLDQWVSEMFKKDKPSNGNIDLSAVANLVYTPAGRMDFETFKDTIDFYVKQCPKNWRKGQRVFNVVDAIFGVAREVQFNIGVDCFYDDSKIDEFLQKSYEQYWERIRKTEENEKN